MHLVSEWYVVCLFVFCLFGLVGLLLFFLVGCFFLFVCLTDKHNNEQTDKQAAEQTNK